MASSNTMKCVTVEAVPVNENSVDNEPYILIMPQNVPHAVNCGKCKQHMIYHRYGHAVIMRCCGVFIDFKCFVDDVIYRRNNNHICMVCPSCNTTLYNF